MAEFNTEIFQFFQDFNDGDVAIDWELIAQDKDLQEQLEDDLDSLIHTAPLLSTIDEKEKKYLLGSLVIAQSHVVRLISEESSVDAWNKAGREVQDLLKELINSGSWLQEADKRFDKLADMEEKFASNEVSPAELDYFAPVLVALAILSLFHIGQEDEDEEDAD